MNKQERLQSYVAQAIQEYYVPGAAVVFVSKQERLIVTAGRQRMEGPDPVTDISCFQLASLSKPILALCALHLFGSDFLEFDIEPFIRREQIPIKVEFNGPVFVKDILSHSAGFNIHGFRGYKRNKPLPNIQEMLRGIGPANNSPLQIDYRPRSRVIYSGGGFVFLQKVIEELEQNWKAGFLNYFAKMGMNRTSFEQIPLGVATPPSYCFGHEDEQQVLHGWHLYPEIFAAGLWSNALDISRFLEFIVFGKIDLLNLIHLTKSDVSNDGDTHYCGFRLFQNSKQQHVFLNNGVNVGFECLLYINLDLSKACCVLLNANTDLECSKVLLISMLQSF